jgi:hypothetical protein
MRCAFPAIIIAVSVTACGRSAITADRIERAFEPTFANLVQVQLSWLRVPPVTASDLDVTASCRRTAADVEAGAGEWVCKVRWFGPDRQPLRDTFDLIVTPDGCYTATAEGEQLGGVTLRSRDGRDVRNLLHTFEGCFDTI